MFGVSSYVLNHPTAFGAGEGGAAAAWTTVTERQYDVDVPSNVDLRTFGARMLSDVEVTAPAGFGVGRPNPRRINVNVANFLHPVRVSYLIDEHRLLVERRTFVLAQTLTNMHTHDGYYLRNARQTVWAVVVDFLCVVIVFWIASGIYMWWLLPASRRLGWLAIAAGVSSFTALMFTL
jgi:hypothetical protein